jgi:hypothetical protein
MNDTNKKLDPGAIPESTPPRTPDEVEASQNRAAEWWPEWSAKTDEGDPTRWGARENGAQP